MITFSYSISPLIKKNLEKIEELRRTLAVIPIRPSLEVELQFETMIDHIFYSGLVSNIQTTRGHVKQFLMGRKQLAKKKKVSPIQITKNTLDYIRSDWLSNNERLHSIHIQTIYELLSSKQLGRSKLRSAQNTTLDYFLDYIQQSSENVIMQAAIMHIQMRDIAKFNDISLPIAHMMTLLIFYKNGYDFRKLLSLERYFATHELEYIEQVNEAREKGSLNNWITFFTESLIECLLNTIAGIMARREDLEKTAPPIVNKRQSAILQQILLPTTKVTNRMVQKKFNVSQITASRDLTLLYSLGLLFQHGKGRSVYYTKV